MYSEEKDDEDENTDKKDVLRSTSEVKIEGLETDDDIPEEEKLEE